MSEPVNDGKTFDEAVAKIASFFDDKKGAEELMRKHFVTKKEQGGMHILIEAQQKAYNRRVASGVPHHLRTLQYHLEPRQGGVPLFGHQAYRTPSLNDYDRTRSPSLKGAHFNGNISRKTPRE